MSFRRNLVSYASGSILAQIVAFSILPVVTRFFSPREIGEYTLILVLSGLWITVSTLHLQYVIPISTKPAEVYRTAKSILGILAVITIATAFILMILPLDRFVIITCIGASVSRAWTAVTTQICNREKEYRLISLSAIVYSLATPILSIILVVIGLEEPIYCLLIGYCAGSLLASLPVSWKFMGDVWSADIEIMQLFRRHRELCVYGVMQDAFAYVTSEMPVMIIDSRFGSNAVGSYAIAQKVIGSPTVVISNALGNVFFSHICETSRKRGAIGVLSVYRQLVQNLIIPIMLFVLITYVVVASGGWVMLFGEKWSSAARIAVWMAPLCGLRILGNAGSYIAYLYNEQKKKFASEIIVFAIRISTLVVGIYLLSFQNAIAVFLVVSSLLVLVRVGWYQSLIPTIRNDA